MMTQFFSGVASALRQFKLLLICHFLCVQCRHWSLLTSKQPLKLSSRGVSEPRHPEYTDREKSDSGGIQIRVTSRFLPCYHSTKVDTHFLLIFWWKEVIGKQWNLIPLTAPSKYYYNVVDLFNQSKNFAILKKQCNRWKLH